EKIKKIIESKGFTLGKNFGLCYCPERLDPKNKNWSLHNIPRVIYPSDNLTFSIAKEVYNNINNGILIRVSQSRVAEVVKSFENAFRLVNISLVNELALLCDALGINVNEVLNAASTKPFGYTPFYSSAGAGGHCIPKDPIFLVKSSKKFGFNYKTIESALEINSKIPKYIANRIVKTLNELNLEKSVIVCGLSYKEDMEDMRDSPGFKIISELVKQNCKVSGFDPYFHTDLLNKYFRQNKIVDSKFNILKNLNDSVLEKNSCLCVVQHHKLVKLRIKQIYQNSLIPVIYDCQNKIKPESKSNTILNSLGN
ncbi:MAG: nucleotide sugar dehydrogenase, partial [Candidatus Nitrosomaritimum yanchengensis]